MSLPPGVLRGDPLEYLDQKIRYWREQLVIRMKHGENGGDYVPSEKAIAYIDAYQTMRHDLFGAVLPDDA
jgi:hypothetical protein